MSGIEGGEVTALAAAPSNPQIVYAGTATGRVFRSADAGRDWELASGGIAAVASGYRIDRRRREDPLTVYASAFAVVLVTTDGGGHWDIVPGLPIFTEDVFVNGVVADPKTSGTVYLPIYSRSTGGPGVLKSTDGGRT